MSDAALDHVVALRAALGRLEVVRGLRAFCARIARIGFLIGLGGCVIQAAELVAELSILASLSHG